MIHRDLADLGGWIYWLLVKRQKTQLKEEQSDQKIVRNIAIFLVCLYAFVFLVEKLATWLF